MTQTSLGNQLLFRSIALVLLVTLPTSMSSSASGSSIPSSAHVAQSAKDAYDEAVQVASQHKDARALFQAIVDEFPGSREAKKAHFWIGDNYLAGMLPILDSGPPSNRIDFAIMSEAYTSSPADYRSFSRLAERLPGFLLDSEIYEAYESYFNFHEVYLVSKDDKVDYRDRKYDTALNGEKVGNSNQLLVDHERTREFLSGLPIDDGLAIVLAKGSDEGAGSGDRGIGVLPGEPIREETMRVLGYAFGRLGAEFSTSEYVAEGIPSEAVNLSRSENPRDVPWTHWIKALGRKIGVYEGGGGAFKGIFRPTADGCVMRAGREFCPVCREAIVLRVYERVCPIDTAYPNDQPVEVTLKEKDLKLWVSPMLPKRHSLDASFYIQEAKGPSPEGLIVKSNIDESVLRGDNPARGGWTRSEPGGEKLSSKAGKVDGLNAHYIEVGKVIKSEKLKVGRYWITAWVRDPGQVKGERWVLEDPRGLLTEVMTWELVIKP